MLPLADGVTILDAHTRLARLETNATPSLLLAAVGAAAACCHFTLPTQLRDENGREGTSEDKLTIAYR